MDKFSIVRSVTHPDAGHESASHYLLTGYRPTNDIPAQEMPSYGSIAAKVRGPRRPGLPAYVAVPDAAAQLGRPATSACRTTRSPSAATRTPRTSPSAT